MDSPTSRTRFYRHAVWALLAVSSLARADDWPTYMADYSRSGISQEELADQLSEVWRFESHHPPQPAWGGEAKWDGYNKVYDMKARQTFDRAFHVVVAADRVYFGSSADDKVYCLDAQTGSERWSFFTEGPVRLAPTVYGGRVYVGSDDGYAYCLSAEDGALIWKKRLGPRDYRIPGNARVISAWPLRTGLIVAEGLVYGAAGMFPSEGVYLCSLEAGDGSLKWTQPLTDLPAQGYLLASASRLYVPTGRNNPVVFDRATGRRLTTTKGAGGTYALLAGDTLVFGPGKTGQLGMVEEGDSDQLASFSGNHMIVAPSLSFLHSDTELSALDRAAYLRLVTQKRQLQREQNALAKRLKSAGNNADDQLKNELAQIGLDLDKVNRSMEGCVPWRRPCQFPFSLILAGEHLFAGGDNEVARFRASDGQQRWTAKVAGNAYGLAAAHGRLFVSTDSGAIHCFGGQ